MPAASTQLKGTREAGQQWLHASGELDTRVRRPSTEKSPLIRRAEYTSVRHGGDGFSINPYMTFASAFGPRMAASCNSAIACGHAIGSPAFQKAARGSAGSGPPLRLSGKSRVKTVTVLAIASSARRNEPLRSCAAWDPTARPSAYDGAATGFESPVEGGGALLSPQGGLGANVLQALGRVELFGCASLRQSAECSPGFHRSSHAAVCRQQYCRGCRRRNRPSGETQ